MNPKIHTHTKLVIIFFFTSLWMGCQDNTHRKVTEIWQAERLSELQAPYAWPSVVGLYPIIGDTMTFGSAEYNDIIIEGDADAQMGQIIYQEGSYYQKMTTALEVTLDDKKINSEIRLLTDKDDDGPTIISWQSYQWYLIKRDEDTYLRVIDTLSSYRSKLSTIPYYPISPEWNIPAKFTPADSSDRIVYDNILDMSFNHAFAGYLDFEINDISYRLKAMDSDGESYFVIISDQTTGIETYDGGRYLYPKKADSDGHTYIDFNRAENPPCVFTPYATCPLPPVDNHIDVKIEAGEQKMLLYAYE